MPHERKLSSNTSARIDIVFKLVRKKKTAKREFKLHLKYRIGKNELRAEKEIHWRIDPHRDT